MGSAGPTLDLIDSLKDSPQLAESPSFIDYLHEGFDSSVRIRGLSLTYPGKEEPAISDANLDISQGSFVAIVGQSGAGKSTLVDVLLGVIFPDSGSITISGLEPLEAINKWPGAIGYVPQDVTISSGSIRENVALGFDETGIDDKTIWEALKIAQLDDFVLSLPYGLDTQVGERGTKLSGGQRQRLGVARAVFTKPKLLILDEATSALDGQTELDISEAIKSLKGQVSIVVIAHRLSTIRDADKVVYLSKGKIRATGTFEEVRIQEPEFDHQANIMGL
jgi:ABC-type multidrug transport system fused ATPase/permease subunit